VIASGSMDIAKLRKIPLFAGLSDESLARVAELVTEFEEPAGWVLVEVGQPGSGMFILEEGTAVVELPNGRGRELEPGDFFGELALLTDHPRNARIRARTPVRCLAISRSDFQKLLREEPDIGLAMLPKLAARIEPTS
jgi:CRP-like cAMP-binding protein